MDIKLNVDQPKVYELNVSTPIVAEIGVDMMVKVDAVPYTGETSVTPTGAKQTLPTSGTLVTKDIVVEPIPSNYGLVTWNGATLTIS